jgi:putative flippase GtrA
VRLSEAQRQFLKFGLVGVLGFAVDVAVLYALEPLMGWYLARVFSFWAAASATWWFNRRYTFVHANSAVKPPPSAVVKEYTHYLATMLVGGAVNYAVYAAVMHWLSVPGAALIGVALGSCAGLVLNYLSAKFLVFRKR